MGSIFSGLTLKQAKVCLEQYENRFSREMKDKTEFLGSVIGVTAGVAAEIFCLVSLIRIKDPDAQPGRFIASILGVAGFGGLGAGFAAFGLISLAGWILTSRKVNAVKQFQLGLGKFYQDGKAELERASIAPLMKLVDAQAAKELILPMNFAQLFEAEKALGNKRFSSLIAGVKNFSHGLWRQILEISPESLQTHLSCENVKREQLNYPEMWVGLSDLVKDDAKARAVVEQHLFPALETESQSGETLKVRIGEKVSEWNKELLCKNSGYFRAVCGGGWSEGQTGEIDLTEVAKYADIAPFLDILSGKKTSFSDETLIQLIPLIDYFQVGKMMPVLDNLFVMNYFELSFEERCEIAGNFAAYKNLREHLITTLLNRAVTEENFDEMAVFAAKLSPPEVKEKAVTEDEVPVAAKLSPPEVKEKAVIEDGVPVAAKLSPPEVKEKAVTEDEVPVAAKLSPPEVKEKAVIEDEVPVAAKLSPPEVKEKAVIEDEVPVAAKVTSLQVKEKLQAYALEQLNKALHPMNYKVWLDRAFSMDLTCEQIHKALSDLDVANFRAQYEIGREFKTKGYSQLESECFEFCSRHLSDLKANWLWDIEEMPDEIADKLI